MRHLYIILNVVAAAFLILASNFIPMFILVPFYLSDLQNSFWWAFFNLLMAFLFVIILAGMLLAYSYRRLQYRAVSIWILAFTLSIAVTAVAGFWLTNEMYEPLYHLFVPEWLIAWLIPGYYLIDY